MTTLHGLPSEYDWAGKPRRPSLLNPLGLPAPLTLKQKLYLYGPQGIMAACIDGGVNFAIAYAMYHSADQVRLWPLAQNTIAGDIAVTTFIQGIITFCVVSGMVNVDLRNHKVDPFPYPWPDTKWGVKKIEGAEKRNNRSWRLWKTFHNKHGLGRGLHFFSGSHVQDILDFSVSASDLRKRWFWAIWKGSVLSALFWFLLWPISIAILAPLYGGRNMAHTWVPEVVKLLYGFILGLLQNPICCALALGSEDAVREHLRESQKIEWAELMGRGYSTTAGELVRQSIESPRKSVHSVHSHYPNNNRHTVETAKTMSPTVLGRSNSSATVNATSASNSKNSGNTPNVVSHRKYSRSAVDLAEVRKLANSLSQKSPAEPSPALTRSQSTNTHSQSERPLSTSVPIASPDLVRVKTQSKYDARRSLDSSIAAAAHGFRDSSPSLSIQTSDLEQGRQDLSFDISADSLPRMLSSPSPITIQEEPSYHQGEVSSSPTTEFGNHNHHYGGTSPRSSMVRVASLKRSLTSASRPSVSRQQSPSPTPEFP